MQPRRVAALGLGADLHAHAAIWQAPVAGKLGRQVGQRHRPGLECDAQARKLGRQEAGQGSVGGGELGVGCGGQGGEGGGDAAQGIVGFQSGQHALDLGARGADRQA